MEKGVQAELRLDNKTFEDLRERLDKKYHGKWVTVHRGKVVSVGKSYDDSASKARKKFGEEPMVTRKIVPKTDEKYWIL